MNIIVIAKHDDIIEFANNNTDNNSRNKKITCRETIKFLLLLIIICDDKDGLLVTLISVSSYKMICFK